MFGERMDDVKGNILGRISINRCMVKLETNGNNKAIWECKSFTSQYRVSTLPRRFLGFSQSWEKSLI